MVKKIILITFMLLTTMLVKSQKIYSVNYSDTTISKSIMEFKDTCGYVYVVFSNKLFINTIQKYFKENGIKHVPNKNHHNWIKFRDKNKGSIYYELKRVDYDLYYLKI